jgi:hypothetical protein
MKLDMELAAKVLTGLDNGTFEQSADDPAEGDEDFQDWVDEIADVVDEHGYELVSAVAQYAQHLSEDVRSHELDDFIQQHYVGCGHRVGDVLMEYAQDAEGSMLHDLHTALDNAGAVDHFEWEAYADSSQLPLEGLTFIKVPTTGLSAPSVFLFKD